MARTRKVGFGIDNPSKTCDDKNCPFHGSVKIRGKQFIGTIVSDKMQKSAVVEWIGWKYIPKYERYKRTRTKVVVHNPTCIDAKEGDLVKIGESRSLSKTKSFVILKIIGKEEKYKLEKEALASGKHKDKVKDKLPASEKKPENPENPKVSVDSKAEVKE